MIPEDLPGWCLPPISTLQDIDDIRHGKELPRATYQPDPGNIQNQLLRSLQYVAQFIHQWKIENAPTTSG